MKIASQHPSGLDHVCIVDYSRLDYMSQARQKQSHLTDQTEAQLLLSTDFYDSERMLAVDKTDQSSIV